MNKSLGLKSSVATASLLAMATACGGGSSSTNESAAGINMQAPTRNGSAQAMPSGPFAQSEMQMHERMMAATGASASETWLRKMIEHHRGAVQMSQVLIDTGGDPAMVQMARTTVEEQQREINEMERMLAGGIAAGSGQANPFGPVEQSMHQQMVAAAGANLSETWARKMISHHQGAVGMAEVLDRQGGSTQVLTYARRVAGDQRREIAHLEAMLRGEPMPTASAPAASAAPASQPAPAAKESTRIAPARADRGPSPAPKSGPVQRSAERDQASERPTPTAEPSPAPKATCTPEHRAMGHC